MVIVVLIAITNGMMFALIVCEITTARSSYSRGKVSRSVFIVCNYRYYIRKSVKIYAEILLLKYDLLYGVIFIYVSVQILLIYIVCVSLSLIQYRCNIYIYTHVCTCNCESSAIEM